jgi:transcriptional regulator with XRE-family HTH domain
MNEDDVLNRIQELCAQKGWSTYKLHKESGIPYSSLNNFFQRNNIPTVPTLIKICDGLNVSLSAFFATDGEDCPSYSDKQKEIMQRFGKLSRRDKKLLEGFLSILEE